MRGSVEKPEEEEKGKEQQEKYVMLVETDSKGEGDIPGNVNTPMKRKKYVSTTSYSKS